MIISNLIKLKYLPFRTCTLILAITALDCEHEYIPESVKSASCISKYESVTSPFFVIISIPPLADS